MPLEQIANIAEVFGLLVVGLSLVFLTLQMRQNTKATKSAAAIQSTAMVTAWYREISNSERSSALFLNAMADPEAQTAEAWIQFVFSLHGLLLAFQSSFYLVKEGTLDERINHSLSEVTAGVKDQPGFLLYWRQRGAIFYPEFQNYIDEIIASDRQVSQGMYKDIKLD